MAEHYFALSKDDQREILEQAREKTGKPTHLLEKDVWVVWTLGTLFESALATGLTFKGGTSLSKAYKIIDRFSEDLDLTYDIRKLIADLTGGEEFLPASRSRAGKWTKAVRDRLPEWIASDVQPILQKASVGQTCHFLGGRNAAKELGGNGLPKQAFPAPAKAAQKPASSSKGLGIRGLWTP